MQIADAPEANLVDLYAPPALQPYLHLSRIDRPIGTWLLLLPCFWGLELAILTDLEGIKLYDLWIFIACIFGAVIMRGAGCTWNDITDRHFDAQVTRTMSRPLPSGRVTLFQAVLWLGLQCLAGGLILISLPPLSVKLGLASLILVLIYPFAKRFTWWPQFFLGLTFNWGILLAFSAHSNAISPAALILWCAGISWTLFYDTIYAHQDKDDDAMIGVKSTARLFGDDQTGLWLTRFLIGAALCGLCAVMLACWGRSLHSQIAAITGIALFSAHLGRQKYRLDTTDSENCLRLFRSNRNAGLIVALFLAVAIML